LATLGSWLVETMLTTAIIQRTGLPMHTTRISSETRAHQWLPDGFQSKCGSTAIADSDRLLVCVNSVYNHVMYSYVCCQIGIHNHILESSDELKSNISDFAKIAHLASAKPQMLWPTLSARDAPRALSDTLLKVVAAVFLDTNWSTFQKLFDSWLYSYFYVPYQEAVRTLTRCVEVGLQYSNVCTCPACRPDTCYV
jgi:hypothetical protein